jgi:hypothetical protein
MKLYKLIFTLSAITLLAGSCKKQLDELIVNPNTPTLDKADTDLYLNAAQLSFADLFNGNSNTGMQLTRLRNFGGANYAQGYRPESFNGIWSVAYRSILTQINSMEPLAAAQNRWHHVGIGQVLKAYTGMTMVDFFGDIPWSEAANPANSVINPKIDKGADVYAACIKLLDDAIANFAKTAGSPVASDIYYSNGGATTAASITKWVTLAKTLKLRAYITTRLTDATAGAKIAALVTAGDLIDTEAEDFVFRYGTQLQNPDSRHPDYAACYRAAGGVGTYISNYLAWEMVSEKPMIDPRTRYYFRRQSNARNGQAGGFALIALSCQGALSPSHYPVGMAYCMVNDGYFGRDHGDASGIPPDGTSRTAWGCYPAGGDFDGLPVNTGASVSTSTVSQTANVGGKGAGIHPIWLSSYTHFLLAEAVLAAGVTGNARTLLETGIRQSIKKVIDFPATMAVTPPTAFVPTTAQIDAYVNEVLTNRYDLAINNNFRLNVIMKEFHIALFGNGIEAYNSYRRTGYPDNMQPTLSSTPGPFIKSVWYPADHVTLNTNAKQKADNSVKVFWDNGSANVF